MELALAILLGVVSLICLLGGTNLLTKGVVSFLPEDVPPQIRLDNIFRFLSGIYFSLGFLMAWVVFHVHLYHELLYFIGTVVIFSGLGRLYSRFKVGSGGNYLDSVMVFEMVLGTIIIVLQYLR